MQSKYHIRKAIKLGTTLAAAVMLSAGCGGRGEPSIHAQPQTISFAAAPALTLGGTATVSATASSGLAVRYSSATQTVCSVDSDTGLVTNIAVGVCIIAADQPGNTQFAPAPRVTQNITVIFDPNQTLNFGATPELTLFGTATVSATATSGLAVSYSSFTPGICSVNSGTGFVTDIAAGDCIIAADQPGDANYFAAPQVTMTITVAPWGGSLTVPGAPTGVTATLGDAPDTVTVGFTGPATSGGSPVTGYTVHSIPPGITATGAASPITVSCATPCTGVAFSVVASNSIGDGPAAQTDILTNYQVTTTFFEPDTQPNNSIFTGSFTYNSTTQTVSNLTGSLTESMTGPPMTTVPLNYQLSSVNDGQGNLLVTTFSLNTTNTFAEGGFAPGSEGLYYGWPSAPNPGEPGGVGNAYITILVNLANPTNPLTQAQINKLAYADCTPGGMMGDVCMTGYSGIGTMGGYPVSQTITKQ